VCVKESERESERERVCVCEREEKCVCVCVRACLCKRIITEIYIEERECMCVCLMYVCVSYCRPVQRLMLFRNGGACSAVGTNNKWHWEGWKAPHT